MPMTAEALGRAIFEEAFKHFNYPEYEEKLIFPNHKRGAITQQSSEGREGIAINDDNKRKSGATNDYNHDDNDINAAVATTAGAGGKKKKLTTHAGDENINPQEQDVDFDNGDGSDIEGLDDTNNTANGTTTTQQTSTSTQQNAETSRCLTHSQSYYYI